MISFFFFRGAYERIAIQNNDDQNSHTLAEIHIQVNTKIPIKLCDAKWALRSSLEAQCIIKLFEKETTGVKRRRAKESDKFSRKEPRMSQDSDSED